MTSTSRKELQSALCGYAAETLTYIDTVRRFCQRSSRWILGRESELEMMLDIKDRADQIDLKFNHVTNSENKGKALGEYLKSLMTQGSADSRREELEKELSAVLKDTLQSLQELDGFLEAVEMLAVTSLHVFMEENPVLHLPAGISLQDVQVVVIAARRVCPLLLIFKRDADNFFLPRLHNVEVLSYQLDKYIKTTQTICEKMEKSSFSSCCLEMNPMVNLDVDLPEEGVQMMLSHINLLHDIRMDKNFRMVFLHHDESSAAFVREFSERQPRMLQFLNDLEQSAVQLDRMNTGAKISSVAGSSVGVVGGVLSIVGLALIPVTAGVSLGLTMAGVGLGVTSGVNSLVTMATETGVNCTQHKKASEVFKSFMEDVQILQGCLEEVTEREESPEPVPVVVGKMVFQAGAVGKGVDAIIDAASALKMLKAEEVVVSAGKVAVQEGKALRKLPMMAADIPDVGQAAIKGPLALSKSARAGLIAVNALFIGMDLFFICKDSISLSKGTKTLMSQFIRARAALWRSEMDSWQKIYDAIRDGKERSEKNSAVVKQPFYPEMQERRDADVCSDDEEELKEKQLRAQ